MDRIPERREEVKADLRSVIFDPTRPAIVTHTMGETKRRILALLSQHDTLLTTEIADALHYTQAATLPALWSLQEERKIERTSFWLMCSRWRVRGTR